MNRILSVLAGLLVLQTSIAGALMLTGRDNGAFNATEPLLAFDSQDVQSITIASGDEVSTIEKSDGAWRLPVFDGFTADASKVGRLLQDITDLKRGWPVASNRASAERFGVDEEAFERRIELTLAGDKRATLYFGDSPSFKRIYARNGDDGNVYNVEFSTFDSPTAAGDWADREALHIAERDVTEIKVGDLSLVKADDGFTLPDLNDDEQIRAGELRNLVRAALEISFDDILVGENAPSVDDAPKIEVAVSRNDGVQSTFTFYPEGGDADAVTDYFIKASDYAQLFRVAKFRIDKLIDADRKNLVEVKTNEDKSLLENAVTKIDDATDAAALVNEAHAATQDPS